MIQRKINLFRAWLNKPDFTTRGRLYITAVGSLGEDITPQDEIPDDVACAEVINKIHEKTFGFPILSIREGGASTKLLYYAMVKSSLFQESPEPLSGSIVISPTGLNNRISKIKNGHIGIIGLNKIIMSNNSSNGLFEENYTIDSWKKRFVSEGGYPMLFFNRI